MRAIAARVSIFLLLLLLASAAAGCGTTRDKRAIREVVTLSFTTDDVERYCRRWTSDGFIERTFKTRDRCVRVHEDEEDEEDEEEPADAVDLSHIVVDGDRARAEVEVRGGDADGTAGLLRLVREDGDWRVDDLSTPFLRSLMDASLRPDADEPLPASARGCLGRFMRNLPDAELRRFAYGLIGRIKAATGRTFTILADCEGENGRSALRELFEQTVSEGLMERGWDDQVVGCVARVLRKRFSDDELAKLLAAEDDKAIRSGATEAARACKRRSEMLEPS